MTVGEACNREGVIAGKKVPVYIPAVDDLVEGIAQQLSDLVGPITLEQTWERRGRD